MIEVAAEQRTREWELARIGIPTASRFDQIITPAQLKRSKSDTKYIAELLVERYTRMPSDSVVSDFMNRGTELEDRARRAYAFQHDCEVRQVGFVYKDEARNVGCSPDGLPPGGGLEIKCLSAVAHVQLLMGGLGNDYRLQLQGSLWITGLPWWDFIAYHDELPAYELRVEPDSKVFAAFDEYIPAFLARLETAREELGFPALEEVRVTE